MGPRAAILAFRSPSAKGLPQNFASADCRKWGAASADVIPAREAACKAASESRDPSSQFHGWVPALQNRARTISLAGMTSAKSHAPAPPRGWPPALWIMKRDGAARPRSLCFLYSDAACAAPRCEKLAPLTQSEPYEGGSPARSVMTPPSSPASRFCNRERVEPRLPRKVHAAGRRPQVQLMRSWQSDTPLTALNYPARS